MSSDLIGRIVTSRAGRDKGRRFAVVGIADDAHVLIADGDVRKTARPKRKKLKHLHFENASIDGILEKLGNMDAMADARLRGELNPGRNDDKQIEEG